VRTRIAIVEERDTRERLIEAAGRLFADYGFKKVTVRDIVAAAHANIAAVNYHFGDKLGLYREVVEAAIAAQETTTRESREAGEGLPADERLRSFIRIFVGRAMKHPQSWVRGIIFREMADPTPALDQLVERGIRPRLEYLGTIVAELLECPVTDPRVLPCAGSVQSQLMMTLTNPIAGKLKPGPPPGPAEIDHMVEHITRFSLGGISAMKRQA
jgi:TetR/AcrR family transcriptional regulator, regulator of cefoperazone and chloramphenicol sensitivity